MGDIDIEIETDEKPKTKKKAKASNGAGKHSKKKTKKTARKTNGHSPERRKYELSGTRVSLKMDSNLVDMLKKIKRAAGFETLEECGEKVMIHGISRHYALEADHERNEARRAAKRAKSKKN